jgi:hypothetical protein
MRSRAIAIVTALVLAGALAGCAISESQPEKRDGGPAFAENIVVASGTLKLPPTPDDSRTAGSLVEAFLQASVGGDEEAATRAAKFLTPEAAEAWQPRQELSVVRTGEIQTSAEGGQLGQYTVTVPYRQIGTMAGDGSFTPFLQPQRTVTFYVQEQDPGSSQWRISSMDPLLPTLMIGERVLQDYYQPTPVYYWDSSNTRLVPDLRYLPLTMPPQQRANRVVEWLLSGPSPMLGQAVRSLRGTTLKSQIVPGGKATVVNLSSNATSEEPEEQLRLMHQLRWTLLLYNDGGPVELQIEGQPQDVDGTTANFRSLDAAAADRRAALFSVVESKLVKAPAEGPQPSVLAAKANANVAYAAVSADHTLAAFVPTTNNRVLTVVSTGEGGKLTERRVSLPGPAGRPAWVPGLNRVLVPAGNRLYSVAIGGRAEEVVLNGVAGTVRSVSVAPDGRRIAVATHQGNAYVAALVGEQGSINGGPEARRVAAGLGVNAAAVAWSSTMQVLVAGSEDGQAALWRVTADGAIVRDESPNEQALIDIVAFPEAASARADTLATSSTEAVFYAFPNKETTPAPLISPVYAGG